MVRRSCHDAQAPDFIFSSLSSPLCPFHSQLKNPCFLQKSNYHSFERQIGKARLRDTHRIRELPSASSVPRCLQQQGLGQDKTGSSDMNAGVLWVQPEANHYCLSRYALAGGWNWEPEVAANSGMGRRFQQVPYLLTQMPTHLFLL